MKQPELGRKITELRKEKGLTQEELVEKCNISVRTLQRIEAGDVTPRDYTIRTILAALDQDFNVITQSEDDLLKRLELFFNDLFLIDIEEDRSALFIVRNLNLAWIAGIINFLIGFVEAAADYFLFMGEGLFMPYPVFVFMKALAFISLFLFMRGFIITGYLYRNYLLKIMAYVLIFAVFVSAAFDVITIYTEPMAMKYYSGAESLLYGCLLIVFGISLARLRKAIGDLTLIAGVFELFAGFCFLTIILAFLGLILLIPADLLLIVILYKVRDIIKSKQTPD